MYQDDTSNSFLHLKTLKNVSSFTPYAGKRVQQLEEKQDRFDFSLKHGDKKQASFSFGIFSET